MIETAVTRKLVGRLCARHRERAPAMAVSPEMATVQEHRR